VMKSRFRWKKFSVDGKSALRTLKIKRRCETAEYDQSPKCASSSMKYKVNSNLVKPASGIRSIAAELGISVATVHRALHNRGRVSSETRDRVLRMAAHLEYKPNLAARDLRLNRHLRISVHLPAAIASFFDSLRVGVEKGAEPFRSVVDVEFHRYARSPGRAQASIRTALEQPLDGIIVALANTAQMVRLVRRAQAKAIPVICVSTDVPGSGRLTAVTPYPYCSGAMAAEMLAGCVKMPGSMVALVGDLENLHHAEKIRGFKDVLAKTVPRLSVAAVIEAHDDPEQARRGILRCLRTVPEIGGLYISSANSIGALEALRETGSLHKFPIITTDLFPELLPFLSDGSVKATIYQCPELQGSIAIQGMYRYLIDGVIPPPMLGVIPQLVMKSNLDLYLNRTAEIDEMHTYFDR